MTQPDEDYRSGAELTEDDVEASALADPEAPAADAYEQAMPANPADLAQRPRVPFEADEADAVDQARTVELDDDYDR